MSDRKYDDIFEAGLMFRNLLIERYYDSYKGDLTYQQCRVFDTICNHSDISENELAKKYDLSKQHINLIVSKLLDTGLVSKTRNQADKRSYMLSPTDYGISYYKKHLNTARQNYDNLLKRLSPDEVSLFERNISSLVKLFRKMQEV